MVNEEGRTDEKGNLPRISFTKTILIGEKVPCLLMNIKYRIVLLLNNFESDFFPLTASHSHTNQFLFIWNFFWKINHFWV